MDKNEKKSTKGKSKVSYSAKLAELEKNIQTIKESIDGLEKQKVNFAKQFDIDKQLFDIMLSKFTRIQSNAVWEFERDPTYVKLQRQKQEYKVREDRYKGDSKLANYDDQIVMLKEELKAALKSRDELMEGN